MESRKIFIYTLTCPIDNTVRYIGQSFDPDTRLIQHIEKTRKKAENENHTHKERWIKKLIALKKEYNIKIDILEICNENDCDEREIHWINIYRKTHDLTNTSEGGNAIRLIGENHPNFGKNLSEHTKELIRQTKIGDKNPMYGKRFEMDQTHKTNISKSLHLSEKFQTSRKSKEFSDKISVCKSQPTYLVDCITLEIIKIYNSCREIADDLGYTYSNIKNARRNKRPVAKKFLIIYSKDYEVYKISQDLASST